jgi:hypothetical protein
MKSPAPATILALHLANIALAKHEIHGIEPIAWTATRIVTIAIAVRKLVEHGCNVELTIRQEKRLESLRKRADALLQPYGLELANPWGLCHYACPIGHDGRSESSCTFLA